MEYIYLNELLYIAYDLNDYRNLRINSDINTCIL